MPKAKTKTAKKPAKFSAEERAAMKDYVAEKQGKGGGEAAVMAKINAMPEPDRSLGKRLHALIMAAGPSLVPRTYYGMPAYAKDDKVVCFFQNASKFKTRYGTLGFTDKAKLDEGGMWPTSYALHSLTAADEKQISALVKRAVS